MEFLANNWAYDNNVIPPLRYFTMGYRRFIGAGFILVFIVLIWPPQLDFLNQPLSSIIEDQDGLLLSAQIASGEQWRLPFIDEVPERYEACVLAYDCLLYTSPSPRD